MKENLYRLTSAQNSIWLTEQFSSNTSLNNIGGYVLIQDKVDFACLKKALKLYVKMNPALNFKIQLVDGEPRQYLSDFIDFDIELVTLNNLKEVESMNQEIVNTPFHFLDSNLYRFVMFQLPDGSGGFNATLHHIISDAWSMSLLIDEVMNYYSSLLHNEDVDLTPFPSYVDYIKTEAEYFESTRFKNDSQFWNSMFYSTPEFSYIAPSKKEDSSSIAKRKVFDLDSNLYDRVNNFCKKYNCSTYTFFMSIYSLYIAKINNTHVPVIGTPVLNRSNFKEKHTAGMFISTVPFKVNIDFESSFASFLKEVSSTQLSIFRHQRYPYDVLLGDLKKKHHFSHNLYDMAISYQNAKNSRNKSSIHYTSTWLFNGNCMDTLQVHFYDMDNTGVIQVNYDYQVAKLSENDIDKMHLRIMEMVYGVLKNPEIPLKDIDIINANEKKQILDVFNNSKLEHPRNIGIYDLIKKVGQDNLDHIAVVDRYDSITYSELLVNADKIAKNLIKYNIQKSDCVAVLFNEKNINLICALLGILKTGACFLAVYPDYPNDRIRYMLENSNAKLLITDDAFASIDFNIPVLNINHLEDISEDICFSEAMNDDPAYYIYTSGSTGKPKGTIQTHNNLINFVYSFQHALKDAILPDDNMLSVTNICFDVSVAEIFTALIFGTTLFLYKDLNYSNPYELSKYIMENDITFSYFPPSMLTSIYEELKKYRNVPLNKMLVGVEPIQASILLDFLTLNPDMKIINGYGPSETTICCTMYLFDKTITPDSITPIGSPVGNSKILIYDANQHLVPIGNVGEIYVQGECVGNGYVNNPEITKERFDFKNKIYRTGDLAKWLPDGNILFIGRNDNQIKYRGYRIDLGEIEYCIKNVDLVDNCIVLLDHHIEENPMLVAFVMAKEIPPQEETIRAVLSECLPHYMIPNQFVFLENFPLTPNGKIDRKSLLNFVSYQQKTPYVAPTTDLEKTLANLWKQVLEKDKVGMNDNFFEIGGDSLSAIKIVTLAAQEGISLSAQNFYTYPTISLLLKHCIYQNSIQTKHHYLNEIDIERESYVSMENDIFLIGSTGFLGAHILYELIQKTDAKIYCLIRGDSEAHSTARLKERLHYYFGVKLDAYFDSRIIVVNGDFSKKNFGMSRLEYEFLLEHVKTVINSAAIVKHIGNHDYFYKMNILSVESLIHFCESCQNAHLVHISTLSVSGNHCPVEEDCTFTEKDLFIGQNIDQNVYIETKFEAEQLISEAMLDGLDATIFRLGNISWRSSDGVFQVNENENLFFNFLNFFILTKKVPISSKNQVFNISPVQECAQLIVDILQKSNRYRIYHISNIHTLTLENIIVLLNDLNYNIEFVDDAQYQEILQTYLIQYPYIAQQFHQLNQRNNIIVSHPYTIDTLKELNFDWTTIDINYMKKKFGGIK